MADSEQAFQDDTAIYRALAVVGVDTPIAPPLTGDEGGQTPSSKLDGCPTDSYIINYEKSRNQSFYSASNGHVTISNSVFPLNDTCVQGPSLLIGTAASPLTPGPLIEAYNITQGYQAPDDFSLKCIDPRLLWVSRPADNTPIETPHSFTFDTHPDFRIFPPPNPAPATHYDSDYTTVTPVCYQSPILSGAPAQRAHAIPSRGRNDRIRTQNVSPRHKKRRAKGLEVLAEQPSYHSLPTADREYFDQVVTRLRNASHLVSPQSLEPTVGSAAGRLLIEPRRLTGPGAVAARESVYAVLIHRPSEGAFVCWICGETRADRRLPRALDHVRGHFNHRPYHCSEAHFDQHTGVASVCAQSFTCAEALKDHQTRMKNKSHACDTCGKMYTSSTNVKRHMRKEHSS